MANFAFGPGNEEAWPESENVEDRRGPEGHGFDSYKRLIGSLKNELRATGAWGYDIGINQVGRGSIRAGSPKGLDEGEKAFNEMKKNQPMKGKYIYR